MSGFRSQFSPVEKLAMDRRRKAIFAAGAAAENVAEPIKFEGRELGSLERVTYFDGYASTHPEFRQQK